MTRAEYIRVPTLQINEIFINGLADLCIDIIERKISSQASIYNNKIQVYSGGDVCPKYLSFCPCSS